VERHIRGKWTCEHCETLTQAPVPPQVINKGIPTVGLLAQVLSPSIRIIYPYTVRNASSALPASPSRALLWRSGGGACGVQLQPLVDGKQWDGLLLTSLLRQHAIMVSEANHHLEDEENST